MTKKRMANIARVSEMTKLYNEKKEQALEQSLLESNNNTVSESVLVNSSVGSSAITPFKQKDLERLLSIQIGKAFGVYQKHHTEKWYTEDCYFIDCSAGDMAQNCLTSPQIFLDNLLKFKESSFPSRLYLIEKTPTIPSEPNTFEKLKNNFQIYKNKRTITARVILRHANMQKCLSQFTPHPYRFGLLYFDPNGFTFEDYEALFEFLKGNPRIDVILNINITQLNRNRPVKKAKGFEKYWDFYLSTLLHRLNKDYIWIRDNSILDIKSKFTFVMIFGTNMFDYSIGKNNSHFVPIDSVKGQAIIQKHNFTKNERKQNGNEQD